MPGQPLETMMTANVGSIDRALRVLAGLALMAAALSGVIGMWGWLGVLLVATGVLGFCPGYLPLGIDTCRR
jgi:hypothetical protein